MPDDDLITGAEYALEWGNGDDLHRELVAALKAARADNERLRGESCSPCLRRIHVDTSNDMELPWA